MRAIANGELSRSRAPWWRDLGRLDDHLADCAATMTLFHPKRCATPTPRDDCTRPRSAEQTEAELPGPRSPEPVLARSSKAPPLWLLVWAPSDAEHAESVARVCRDNLKATAAPAPSITSALYAYCAAARAFDGFHLDEGAAADAWLAACPAVARDERPETVAAALVNAERRAIDAGLASKGGHAALAMTRRRSWAGPRAVAAALLDAGACVAGHRARRPAEIRYLACWCGAPVAAKALADAREVRLAVRVTTEGALPALVDTSSSSGRSRRRCEGRCQSRRAPTHRAKRRVVTCRRIKQRRATPRAAPGCRARAPPGPIPCSPSNPHHRPHRPPVSRPGPRA